MEDGENYHSLRFLDKEHGIRKAPKQDPSDFSMDDLIVQRVLVCLLNCVIEFDHESPTKSSKLGFVRVAGLSGLGFSAASYNERAFHESPSNLSFTSLQEDPSSGSSRYSS